MASMNTQTYPNRLPDEAVGILDSNHSITRHNSWLELMFWTWRDGGYRETQSGTASEYSLGTTQW